MSFDIPNQDKNGEKTEALGAIDLQVQFLSADRQKSGRVMWDTIDQIVLEKKKLGLSADQATEFDRLLEEMREIVNDAAMKDEAPAKDVDYAKLKETAESLSTFVKEL